MGFDAETYWADQPYKKWVVILWRGQGKRETGDTKIVRAKTRDRAIACAKYYSPLTGRVHGVARLATPNDLGAQPARSPNA